MLTYYDIRSTTARKATVDFVTVHLAGSTCAHRKRRSLVICKIFRKAPPLFVSERLGFCFFVPLTSYNRRLLRDDVPPSGQPPPSLPTSLPPSRHTHELD